MIKDALVLFLFALMTYVMFTMHQDIQMLTVKLENADIRIDICYNETAAVQDRVEAQVAQLRFDLETLQLVLGIQRGVATE